MFQVVAAIWSDIKKGEHIDAYVTITVCAVALVASLNDKIPTSAINQLVLAALGLFATTNLIAQKRILESIVSQRVALSKGQFLSLRDDDYKEEFAGCKRISMLGIANFRFLASHSSALINVVEQGGLLRQVVLDADCSSAMEMAIARSIGLSEDQNHTLSQIRATVEKLKEIRGFARKRGAVHIRAVGYVPSYVMMWFEKTDGTSIIYVVQTGFRQRTDTRPVLRIDPRVHAEAFAFYSQYFENLWSWNNGKDL